MNEEEELCDAMESVMVCATGDGDDDDDDDDEPSDLFQIIWRQVRQLSLEELTKFRNKASARIAVLKFHKKEKDKVEKPDELPTAKGYLAEMTRWKGAKRPHHKNQSEYYLWYKWNTDKYSPTRDKAVALIKKCGLLPPDYIYKVDVADVADEGGPAARGPVKAGEDGKDGKDDKAGEDGAK